VAWPSHPELWLDDLEPARTAVAALCRALADGGEPLSILAPVEQHAALDGIRAQLHDVPFGDIWLRDTAPVFVRRDDGDIAAARFAGNGWGGKYLFENDIAVGDAIAALAGKNIERHGWVLEGGAIDSDGDGTLLTTRQCLLNPNRNPGMDQRAVEAALREAVGARRVLWLDEGLRNDHTDGHVDNIARFVAPGVVACMKPIDDDDPHRDILIAIARDLVSFGLELVQVPSPGLVRDSSGDVMPASYLNFYIGNQTVAVPVYGAAQDARAVEAIGALFPGRSTIGIDARGLLTGGGAFHCITREQPQ
jgi:agmatine deiminase